MDNVSLLREFLLIRVLFLGFYKQLQPSSIGSGIFMILQHTDCFEFGRNPSQWDLMSGQGQEDQGQPARRTITKVHQSFRMEIVIRLFLLRRPKVLNDPCSIGSALTLKTKACNHFLCSVASQSIVITNGGPWMLYSVDYCGISIFLGSPSQ